MWQYTKKYKVRLLHCLSLQKSQSNYTHARTYSHHSQHTYTRWNSACSDVRRHIATSTNINVYSIQKHYGSLYQALVVYE